MTAQLHTAFHPQDSKKGLKSEILSKCTQTHTFGRIHTYITLSTSLMKVECSGRCLPAARHSPSSSLRQEAKDTRSEKNCRENPGRQNLILKTGIQPNTWSTLCIIALSLTSRDQMENDRHLSASGRLCSTHKGLELEMVPDTWGTGAIHTACTWAQ